MESNNVIKTENDLLKNVSDDELSDDFGLEIVISTPKKRKDQKINEEDQKLINQIEAGFEKTLELKATKSNLSEFKVKSILKHVISNEAVLDLIKKVEHDEKVDLSYEPKLTRSKAKVLSYNSPVGLIIPEPIPTIPLTEPEPTPEVKALLTEELREDSSGDEYVPGDEESDEENGASTIQTLDNSKLNDSRLEETFSTIPDELSILEEDEANIALRTRSKFSLSATPLEKLEQSFVPPDLMTDDVTEGQECNADTDHELDNEDWSAFLQSFSKPLEEVFPEDEELDPEYNILADDDIDEVDKEELREDKAVKVSRREINDLIAELFEYTDIYSMKTEAERLLDDEGTLDLMDKENAEKNLKPAVKISECVEPGIARSLEQENEKEINESVVIVDIPLTILQGQILLLEQQIRQHIQLLTQNFLLTYCHPQFNNYAFMFKEYLLNLKLLSEGKLHSSFSAINLDVALKLVHYWQSMYADDIPEAKETIRHFQQIMDDAIEKKNKEEFYHLPFPPLILQTISCCDVFIYPHLLPKIPYKDRELLPKYSCTSFLPAEDYLIALGLDQFISVYSLSKDYVVREHINLRKIAHLICEALLPTRNAASIYRRILKHKDPKHLPHPIAFYFSCKKAPYTLHYVALLEQFKILPPKDREPKSLPLQWRNYIYPKWKDIHDEDELEFFNPTPSIINNSMVLHKIITPKNATNIAPKDAELSDFEDLIKIHKIRPKNNVLIESLRPKFIKHFIDQTPLLKIFVTIKKFIQTDRLCHVIKCICIGNNENMGNEENELPNESETKSESLNTDEDCEIECDKNDFKDKIKNTKKESKTSDTESKTESSEKDVLGSSAVKCVRDKKDFISEKKKAKIRKEYYANKAMLSTPDPLEDKRQRDNFAQAYFDKLKEILDIDDYYKVIDILKSSDLKTGDAVDLYRKLDPILRSKYQDLADEFLLFLNIEQANAIGKLLPYFIMNNMTEFLRKLDIYFKDQPSQIRKIYRSLIELNDSGEATLLKTKNMILPLLKGNPLLCDGFLQIFLEEKPPPTLLNGSDLWEFIDIKKDHSKNDEMTSFETISVEDTEDPYGGPTCVCTCHQTDEQQGAKSHCINCGLKFLQGKVYCQTPKGLKPVTVTFPHDKEVDHNVRLGAPGRIKKSETSPNKRQGSPSKEPIEEKLIANKKPKPKSKKQIFKEKESSKVFKKEIGAKKLGIIKSPPLKKRKSKIIKKADTNKGKEICKKEDTEKPGHSSGQIKRTFTSVIDWKNMPSPDDIEVHTSDSESSQQEGISELKPTNINKNPSEESKSETDVWTREEDKIILETFQQNMENDALNVIADKLRSRSTEDIKKRFQILMSLLQEMTNS